MLHILNEQQREIKMSIVLFNPTNEFFRGNWAGRSFPIPPDKKIKVDDSCGKHVLNEYGPRGLCALDYGDQDKIEEIARDGLERNMAFKKKQIVDHNQKNAERKAIGLPHLVSSRKIIEYAKELSIKLIEPYNIDEGDHSLMTQNKDLQARIESMEKLLKSLIPVGAEVIKEVPEPEWVAPAPAEVESIVSPESTEEIKEIFSETEREEAFFDTDLTSNKPTAKKKHKKKKGRK